MRTDARYRGSKEPALGPLIVVKNGARNLSVLGIVSRGNGFRASSGFTVQLAGGLLALHPCTWVASVRHFINPMVKTVL